MGVTSRVDRDGGWCESRNHERSAGKLNCSLAQECVAVCGPQYGSDEMGWIFDSILVAVGIHFFGDVKGDVFGIEKFGCRIETGRGKLP